MPSPTPETVHVDQLLSNVSIAYRPVGMIAEEVFPVVPVNKQSGLFPIYNKSNWFRIPNTRHSPGTNPNEVSFTVGSGQYICQKWGLGTDVWYETQRNADNPYQPLQDGTEFLRDQLALDYEARVFTLLSTGCGSQQLLTGTDALNDFDNSDPLTVFRTARQAVRSTTGRRPNTCIIGQKAWDVLQYHPDLVRAAYPGAGIGGTLQQDQFARILGVDRILVGETIKNTAQEGQTDTFTDVWSTHIFYLYVEPSPGLMKPTFGYSFRWAYPNDGTPPAFSINRMEAPKRESTELWTSYYQDERILAPELGFLIGTGIS